MSKKPVGLQLYTLRDETAKDFRGTLARVAEMGYRGVELAGNGGLDAGEMRQALAETGLKAYGSHVGLDQLERNLPAVIAYHQEIGCEYLACPWLPEGRRQDGLDYQRLGMALTEIGRKCGEAGLQLCYHNHAFEFQRFGGSLGLDLLYGAADPRLVQAELDLYWIEYAGQDPAAYLRQMKGRCPLVHLKDMATDRHFTEVGEGTLDWPGIFAAAEDAGTKYYLVEQDDCRRPPLESVRISLENLRRMGILS
ncbi:MAG: sugar phosphate isomerase/epimerase family protein [Bacteroidota bacterium]